MREISSGFVHPPTLEEIHGGRTFKIRSEENVWPLYFLHVLASLGGLVEISPGRRWQLTPLGESFMTAIAPIQVLHLLTTWWTQADWRIAFYVSGLADGLPEGFECAALKLLLELPVERPAEYQPFAGRLIQVTGMVWPIEDQESARRILYTAIERMVVQPLESFEILTTEYRPEVIAGAEFEKLGTIQVTAFGRDLLEALETNA